MLTSHSPSSSSLAQHCSNNSSSSSSSSSSNNNNNNNNESIQFTVASHCTDFRDPATRAAVKSVTNDNNNENNKRIMTIQSLYKRPLEHLLAGTGSSVPSAAAVAATAHHEDTKRLRLLSGTYRVCHPNSFSDDDDDCDDDHEKNESSSNTEYDDLPPSFSNNCPVSSSSSLSLTSSNYPIGLLDSAITKTTALGGGVGSSWLLWKRHRSSVSNYSTQTEFSETDPECRHTDGAEHDLGDDHDDNNDTTVHDTTTPADNVYVVQCPTATMVEGQLDSLSHRLEDWSLTQLRALRRNNIYTPFESDHNATKSMGGGNGIVPPPPHQDIHYDQDVADQPFRRNRQSVRDAKREVMRARKQVWLSSLYHHEKPDPQQQSPDQPVSLLSSLQTSFSSDFRDSSSDDNNLGLSSYCGHPVIATEVSYDCDHLPC